MPRLKAIAVFAYRVIRVVFIAFSLWALLGLVFFLFPIVTKQVDRIADTVNGAEYFPVTFLLLGIIWWVVLAYKTCRNYKDGK